jgi:DNA-directed RNA polymerase subunit K/omega
MSKNKNKEIDELSEIIDDTEIESYDENINNEEYDDNTEKIEDYNDYNNENEYADENNEENENENENENEENDTDLINTIEDTNTAEWEMTLKENRITKNRLSNYEMVRILGERTLQLTMGAKPLVKNYDNLDYYKIAEEELKLNMTPFKIKRNLPNKKYEIWTLDELNKDHLLSKLN